MGMRNTSVLLVSILMVGAAIAERPDLHGEVRGPDGQALEGATAYIYTAKVKVGTSPYCPSCYLDCGKLSTSGADGRLTIPSLDPELLFKVLVVAQGYQPAFLEDVDPAKGLMVAVLAPIPQERLAPEHCVHGRVLDPDGVPVIGATIEVFGRKTARGSMYGTVGGVDPLAVSNERGEFSLTAEEPNVTLFATARARGLAAQNFSTLRAGSDVHELRLNRGVTVKGRLLKDGKPVEGAVVGVVQVDRSSGDFYGEYTIGLTKDGSFEIPNLPPNCAYYAYGKMESLRGKGAVPVRPFEAGGHGTATDVGTLEVVPGLRVTGRVVLSDGNPVPAQTRLMFGSESAWDVQTCELDPEGLFTAEDLPPGEYSVSVSVKGYRMSAENYSLDPLNRFGLMGVVVEDIEGLTILLEPGEVDHSGRPDTAAGERYQQLKKEALRGVKE